MPGPPLPTPGRNFSTAMWDDFFETMEDEMSQQQVLRLPSAASYGDMSPQQEQRVDALCEVSGLTMALELMGVRVANQWEYFEDIGISGGWKPFEESMNDFLEDHILWPHDTCEKLIDDWGAERYEWNFVELTEKRQKRQWRQWHRAEDPWGQWRTVSVCSIRRVMVLMAPDRPAEWFPLPGEPVPADWAPAPPVVD